MKLEQHWNIIARLFKNRATQDELDRLDKWLDDADNAKLFNEIFYAYRTTGSFPNYFTPEKIKAWKKVEKRISAKEKNKKKYQITIGYAAAFLMLIFGFSILWKTNINKLKQLSNQQTQIISPLGQKTKIILPDSSFVWLNSGSTLKYQADFNSKNREVILEGEAFFKIHKNKSKRFRVRTGILNVDVYGTSFNIKNYKNDACQEITVEEGVVGISDSNSEIKKLLKGDRAILEKANNKISYSKIEPDLSSAWKNNELIFDNTPLEEAVKYLERWYGVNITLDSAMTNKHKYTFRVKTESFREMLEMMKIMTPFEYEINGKEVVIKYKN